MFLRLAKGSTAPPFGVTPGILSDAITSGFAFVGISIALWIKNPAADDWAALCASPVIIFNAWRQLRIPFGELLDASPAPELERKVRLIASKVPGVIGLEKGTSSHTKLRIKF
jgi:divalent metal cation (Fe/Co/Zn/Cd) transporter